MIKISASDKEQMKLQLAMLQAAYPNSIRGLYMFAQLVINTLIPGKMSLVRVQADILKWLYQGPRLKVIQAQRGQTKTALTAIFSVFRTIHKPDTRILIFSQNGKRAKEISQWVVKIFARLEILSVLRPIEAAGDRNSVEAFDVNFIFKGDDRSPSIACQSIEGGAQGARADIIIADDVESLKNSRTMLLREKLIDDCKEFESINSYGEIIYLGTPQTVDSIYNGLDARGYVTRIWPGRYPTTEDLIFYGDRLTPLFREDIDEDPSIMSGYGLHGDMGAPTCPEIFDDDTLLEKEITQGPSKFKLQRMLNTSLADEDTYPLKLRQLIMLNFSVNEGMLFPILSNDPFPTDRHLGNKISDRLFRGVDKKYDWEKFSQTLMYIDTAGGGQNGDEMAYAVIKILGTYVYLWDIGAVKGGYEETELMKIVNVCKASDVKTVWVEKNFGYGAHASMLKGLFAKNWPVHLEEDYATGQKEVRIIDTLEPVINSQRLIVHPQVFENDERICKQYPSEKRYLYSLFHQLSNITREKDCLFKDDRLDALAGAVRQVTGRLDYDMKKTLKDKVSGEWNRFVGLFKGGFGNKAVASSNRTTKPTSRFSAARGSNGNNRRRKRW